MYRGKDNKQEWKFLTNFLQISNNSYLCDDDGLLVTQGDQGLTTIRGNIVQVATCSVGVPTGKKDKDGADIYSGDILTVSDVYYLVVSGSDGFTAQAVAAGGTDQTLTAAFALTTTIAGRFADMPVFADPEAADATFRGHTVSDLQENVAIADGAITGTLKYVNSGALARDWGAGNFIALKFTAIDASETDKIRIGLDPSQGSGLVELDADMNAVCKVTDKVKQKFVVETTVGNDVIRQTFDLSGLTLATE